MNLISLTVIPTPCQKSKTTPSNAVCLGVLVLLVLVHANRSYYQTRNGQGYDGSERQKSLCFNCEKHWPPQGGARNCLVFGKRYARCGKRNDLAKYCKSKHESKASYELAHKGEEIADTSSESGEESSYTVETVTRWGRRRINHFGEVIICGAVITVLPDSGATISDMDEATFQRYGLERKRYNKKNQTPGETL